MAWIKKILIAIGVVFLLVSCGPVRKLKASDQSSHSEKRESVYLGSTLRWESLWYSDTLTGRIPLPQLSKVPVIIPLESQGISLELSLTDSSISYKAVARPVARSKLLWEEDSREESSLVSEERASESEEVIRTGGSWWSRTKNFIIAGLVIYLLWKLRKPIRKIIRL